jgi:threonylcarbamoyladenosine tRNA methylthiotransferase MtaB
MPQLGRDLIKARAARLRAAAQARRTRWLDSLVGSTRPVLIESGSRGHTESFAPVAVPGAARGDLPRVRIIGRDGDLLVGVAA